jgi:hypothetical protein
MTTPSNKAFRFQVLTVHYAVDIVAKKVVMYSSTSGATGSWTLAAQSVDASDEAIKAAGGPVKFVDLIIESINSFLRIAQGKQLASDVPAPANLQDEVLAAMRESVFAFTMMDATVQLRKR